MSENKEMSVKSFSFWFWLFTLTSVILIAFDGGLSIASAHLIIAAMFMRQLSFVNTKEVEKQWIQSQITELNERMDKIDPYKE